MRQQLLRRPRRRLRRLQPLRLQRRLWRLLLRQLLPLYHLVATGLVSR
jgi:hypothetical protein